MFFRRSYVIVTLALGLTGCASSGYDGYDDSYPYQGYYGGDPYYDGPYYGGGYGAFGYNSDFDDFDGNSDRYFHPARHLTCDRARDLCYDRYGPSYQATAQYLGEREANAAFKKYGKKVFLFSPQHGVTCDRRARTCSDSSGVDEDLTDRYFGDRADTVIGRPAAPRPLNNSGKTINARPDMRMSQPNLPNQPDEMWLLNRPGVGRPPSNNDDKNVNQPISRPRQSEPQGIVDNDDDSSIRALSNERSNHSNKPAAMPTLSRPSDNNNAPGNGNSGAGACMFKACGTK
jgi:hypothetical protein